MRFNPAFLGACLIGAAAFIAAPEFNSAALAQDGQAAEEKEKYTLDESIFDIEEGQSADYYVKAEEKLRAEMSKFIAATPNMDDRVGVFGKANAALEKIWRGTFNAEDASDEARAKAASPIVSTLAEEGKTEELVELYKRFKDSESNALKTVAARAASGIGVSIAAAAKDADALADSLKSWEEKEKDVFSQAAVAATAVTAFGGELADQGKGDELEALIDRFKDSEDKAVQNALKNLEGKIRFAKLVGNEMVVEGLYLDKTEIDWKSYRGKVVLVDFWATWCPPCLAEIPNVQKLYEKYHDAGFEVLGYSVDRDLEALEKFEEERKLPWKTASRTLSIAAEKEYVNLSDYYGVESIPTMILVGKDGKVISTEARGAELKRLLEEQFPDVK